MCMELYRLYNCTGISHHHMSFLGRGHLRQELGADLHWRDGLDLSALWPQPAESLLPIRPPNGPLQEGKLNLFFSERDEDLREHCKLLPFHYPQVCKEIGKICQRKLAAVLYPKHWYVLKIISNSNAEVNTCCPSSIYVFFYHSCGIPSQLLVHTADSQQVWTSIK